MRLIAERILKLQHNFLIKMNDWSLKFWNQEPFTREPIADRGKYLDLAQGAAKNINSNVLHLEKRLGFEIDSSWLNDLALFTQVVIKRNQLNYSHGRLLYSVLRDYIDKNPNANITIFETGTARGFSSLCMAKAIKDSQSFGKIVTFDILPHRKEIYWNVITDHTKGKITREKLLEKWIDLLDYVVFIQGYTRVELPKLCSSRINFAFLDGAHTYEDVMFEFNHVSCFQERGDVIVFDDYNLKLFPGIVKAVNEIKMSKIYSIDIIDSENDRAYVIATRLKKSINRLR